MKSNRTIITLIFMSALLMLSMTFPEASVTTINYVDTTVDTTVDVVTDQATYKAALMVGGDETDLGFSYTAIEGMKALEADYGWDTSISKQVEYTDQSRIASEYGAEGYDVVFAVGGQFIETTYFDVAWSYPDTLFVQIPGLNEYVPTPDNVVGLHPAFQSEGMYLAGVLAGSMTETQRLGVVFGEWYEYLSIEYYAFKAGVASVNTDALVFARVAGTWGDAAIGKQITEALIEAKDVDIVVQVADTTGRGVISACQDAGITVIGTVGDQYELAPEITMTSIGMDTAGLMALVADKVEAGTAMDELGGTSWDIPIGNYLHPYHEYEDKIPDDVKDLVIDVKTAIDNGSLVVPRIVSEFPPEDPYTPETTSAPGFQLLELLLTSMIAIPIVKRLRNKQ